MSTNGSVETQLVDSALRTWQQAVDRATKLFSRLNDQELEREVAPEKNRLIYLWGHLLAVSDAMYAQLRLGERLYPEFDAPFLKAPDKTVPLPSAKEVKAAWDEVHERLRVDMAKLTPAEWVERHAVVSEEDFVKEPHRNRFTLLQGRTAHLGFHLGQAVLVK
jgi:DinB superfamily